MSLKRTSIFFAIATMATVVTTPLQSAVHYFLLQGDFNSSSAGVETYKWMVNDTNNVLQSGQDIIDAIFGTMARPTDGGPVSTVGAGFLVDATYYSSFDPPSFYFTGFTHLGLPGDQDDVTLEAEGNNGWTYYNASGSYTNGYSAPYAGEYGDGTWTYANSGTITRSLLGNGNPEVTYDAWVYGSTGFAMGTTAATVQGAANTPIESNFTGPTSLVQSYGNGVSVYSVSNVPEPHRALLFALGFVSILGIRNRRLKF